MTPKLHANERTPVVNKIVNQHLFQRSFDLRAAQSFWNAMAALFALLLAAAAVHAQGSAVGVPGAAPTPAPLIVEGVENGDVFVFRKSVIVRGNVRYGVISLGGDVIVEGHVEGDVAAIGGNVYQRDGAYIGGDVMVLGGLYNREPNAQPRKPQSATITYAGFEQELHEMLHDPASFIAPHFSAGYIGQRLLAVLFWFIVSLALTAVTPGAVSRAAARLQLTSLRVAIIGFVSTLIIFGVPLAAYVLPPVIGTLLSITAVLLLIAAYIFGRVVIHAATGRWLERRLLPEGKRSETVALLVGVTFWTLVLSLPYIWPAVVAGLLVTSLGLALTARYRPGWRRGATTVS